MPKWLIKLASDHLVLTSDVLGSNPTPYHMCATLKTCSTTVRNVINLLALLKADVSLQSVTTFSPDNEVSVDVMYSLHMPAYHINLLLRQRPPEELISPRMYAGFLNTKHRCTCLKKIWYKFEAKARLKVYLNGHKTIEHCVTSFCIKDLDVPLNRNNYPSGVK